MSKSKLEADLATQLRDSKIPAPRRNFRFHPKRMWRFDFAWPSKMLAVEVEGAIFGGKQIICQSCGQPQFRMTKKGGRRLMPPG